MPASFALHGPAMPASPVILSVPHGGRDYPAALLDALRVPVARLVGLEDRHIDTLALAAPGPETVIVQRLPRAWIDLNRAETDRDPLVDEGAQAAAPPIRSAKVRSGLGLIPRRAGAAGDVWRRRFTAAEVAARIAEDHRPYHAMVAQLLDAAQARFGAAILLDLHSMPPLGGPHTRPPAAQVVIGDLFGRSAAPRLVTRIAATVRADGLRVALNAPYAGGHVIERHAAAAVGRHAIQLELDRTLYLDAALDAPGAGFATTAALVRRIAAALADELLGLSGCLDMRLDACRSAGPLPGPATQTL